MRSPGPIDPSKGNFQGLLLAAHPDLRDPNFRRSVLFMTMHDAGAGALGFVLNRPLGKNAADLLPQHEQQELLQRVPVYMGGPVGHDQLGFADLEWDADDKTVRLNTNLSLEQVAMRLEENPRCVRAFVGYAGWAAGQLEGELEQEVLGARARRRTMPRRWNTSTNCGSRSCVRSARCTSYRPPRRTIPH